MIPFIVWFTYFFFSYLPKLKKEGEQILIAFQGQIFLKVQIFSILQEKSLVFRGPFSRLKMETLIFTGCANYEHNSFIAFDRVGEALRLSGYNDCF